MTEPRPPRPAGTRQARNEDELRLHGLNACRVAFARRPDDLRKVYLSEARIAELRDVLAWCVRHRIGYRVVPEEDLVRLSGSSHHEGVIFDMRRPRAPGLEDLLQRVDSRPAVLAWMDGVGNPHNLGAVLRSSAHFAVDALLIPPGSGLRLSGAACRVAEGGAEAVPLIRLTDGERSWQQLEQAGFQFAATLPHGGSNLYAQALPKRLVLVFGAEQTGMRRNLIERCVLRLGIPGSGAVESLNISAAAAVFMAEWRRQWPLLG